MVTEKYTFTITRHLGMKSSRDRWDNLTFENAKQAWADYVDLYTQPELKHIKSLKMTRRGGELVFFAMINPEYKG